MTRARPLNCTGCGSSTPLRCDKCRPWIQGCLHIGVACFNPRFRRFSVSAVQLSKEMLASLRVKVTVLSLTSFRISFEQE